MPLQEAQEHASERTKTLGRGVESYRPPDSVGEDQIAMPKSGENKARGVASWMRTEEGVVPGDSRIRRLEVEVQEGSPWRTLIESRMLAQQAGPRGVAIISAAMIFVALAAWLWSVTRDLSPRGRRLGAIAVLVLLLAALWGVSQLRGTTAAAVAQVTRGEAYSAAKLASYRAEGRPVFVDATAAWCITCLVNEEAVLSKGPVQSAFVEKNVVYMVADWTNRNPEITALLKENGRSGVPLYLYYAPGSAGAQVLPQILTDNIVLAALNG